MDTPGEHDWTPLMCAASDGNPRMVAFLLSNKAQVNAEDISGCTVLVNAVFSGNLPCVRLLLEHGADANGGGRAYGHAGITALMDASSYGFTDIARLLLQFGANVNAQARANGTTALIMAVFARKYDCAKLLLAHGADRTLRFRNGETAVTYAQKSGDARLLKLFGL